MSKQSIKRVANLMDKGVSFYAFGIAFVLVIYMITSLVVGSINFLGNLSEILVSTNASGPGGDEAQRLLEINILHFIAFSIVLIKAYRVLISYAKTQHINIKYLVEISIIAPAIEILFKSHSYTFETLALFAVFGFANLFLYVWKYDSFKQIGADSD